MKFFVYEVDADFYIRESSMSNLPWPQPGQCWRSKDGFGDGVDRAKLSPDGWVSLVGYKDDTTLGMFTLADTLVYERTGKWHRCPDEPKQPEPVDFGEPWRVGESGYVVDRDGMPLWGKGVECSVPRYIACVNALQGVRNPAAVKALIEALRLYAKGMASLQLVFDTLAALDKDTTK